MKANGPDSRFGAVSASDGVGEGPRIRDNGAFYANRTLLVVYGRGVTLHVQASGNDDSTESEDSAPYVVKKRRMACSCTCKIWFGRGNYVGYHRTCAVEA